MLADQRRATLWRRIKSRKVETVVWERPAHAHAIELTRTPAIHPVSIGLSSQTSQQHSKRCLQGHHQATSHVPTPNNNRESPKSYKQEKNIKARYNNAITLRSCRRYLRVRLSLVQGRLPANMHVQHEMEHSLSVQAVWHESSSERPASSARCCEWKCQKLSTGSLKITMYISWGASWNRGTAYRQMCLYRSYAQFHRRNTCKGMRKSFHTDAFWRVPNDFPLLTQSFA